MRVPSPGPRPLLGQVPDGCNLPADDVPERLARWAALGPAVLARDEASEMLRVRFAAEALDDVRRLVELERSCCSHLVWTLDGDTLSVMGDRAPSATPF